MKHLLPSFLLAAGLSAAALSAQAQVTFGPRLGLNVSTFSDSYQAPEGLDSDTKSLIGVQVGGTVSIPFAGNFAFQPSLLFSQKGAEMVASATDKSNTPYTTSFDFTAKPTLSFLEVPLNLVYTFGGEEGFQVFAGPYMAFGMGGSGTANIKVKSDDPDLVAFGLADVTFPIKLKVEYGDKQNDNEDLNGTIDPNNPNGTGTPTATMTVRGFDAGLNAGIGYRKGPFQAQLGYGLGLVNMVPKDTDGNDTGSSAYHRVIQLSANYFFGGK